MLRVFLAVTLFTLGAMAATFAVTVAPDENLIFVPSVVNASVGDTILWTWGSDFHTVTQVSQRCQVLTGGFDSGIQNTGDTFNITVTEPGVISYVCQPHCLLGMQASINVN